MAVQLLTGRVQVIQLEKGAPERFPFCGTLPRSANFGALETENRAFCEILGGKKEPQDLIFCHCEALVPFRTQRYGPPSSRLHSKGDDASVLQSLRLFCQHDRRRRVIDNSGGTGCH